MVQLKGRRRNPYPHTANPELCNRYENLNTLNCIVKEFTILGHAIMAGLGKSLIKFLLIIIYSFFLRRMFTLFESHIMPQMTRRRAIYLFLFRNRQS